MQFSIITSNRQNVIKSLEQTKLQMPPKIVDKKKKPQKNKTRCCRSLADQLRIQEDTKKAWHSLRITRRRSIAKIVGK